LKVIVNMSDGGLCNRLLPLSSCYAYSQVTGRKLLLCWEPKNVCMCPFNDLFEDQIEQIPLADIPALPDIFVCADRAELNGHFMFDFLKQYPCNDNKWVLDPGLHNESILYYNCLPANNLPLATGFLRCLRPVRDLQAKIDDLTDHLDIDSDVYGAHARLTDYGITGDRYARQIGDLIAADNKCRVFLCSDDPSFEQAMRSKYPTNIIIHEKAHAVEKERAGGWIRNVNRPRDSVREALVDLYLLSKTNIKIYNPSSTFVYVAQLLGGSVHQYPGCEDLESDVLFKLG